MPMFGNLVQWIISVALFLICCAVGLTIGTTLAGHITTNIAFNYLVGLACATIFGALTGVLTVPPKHRKIATYLFTAPIIGLLLYSTVMHYFSTGISSQDQGGLLGAVAGSAFVKAITGRVPSQNNYQDGADRRTVRWFVATLVASVAFLSAYPVTLLSFHWFGGSPILLPFWAAFMATMIGVSVGVAIVPASQQEIGFWLFVSAVNLFSLQGIVSSALYGHLHPADFLDPLGSMFASVSLWSTLRAVRNQRNAIL